MKKVFIAGGTGFLGRAALEKFANGGVAVAAASRSGGKACGVEIDRIDFFAENPDVLADYFEKKDFDVFVYALGPDDRVMPPASAYGYFREKLVVRCRDILHAAVRAGAKRLVVLGSYFAYFDKLYGGALSLKHPYIRARREQEEAALRLGKSRPAVANALRLLQLPDAVREMVEDKELTAGHARALLAIRDADRMTACADEVRKRGLSVRETEHLVKKYCAEPKNKQPRKRHSDPFYTEAELSIGRTLGRNVQIKEGKKGGRLIIEYFDKEDLKKLSTWFEE